MPYVSDAQRRFFHSPGAAKVGITPAMVKEYDEASRGKKLPEKVEKGAQHVLETLAKLAVQSAMSSAKLTGLGTSPTKATSMGLPGGARKVPTPNIPGSLNPGIYQDSFLSNSGSDAQGASSSKLVAGEPLTMP